MVKSSGDAKVKTDSESNAVSKEVFEARREVLNKYVRDNPYILDEPTTKQAQFLTRFERKVLYGGAAGGGKSRAQLQAALMFVKFPQYGAVLFRRTYPQLDAEDSLIDQSHDLLDPTDAKWNESKSRWRFPSGATLRFSHMQYVKDRKNFKSAAYHYIGFDEASEFEPKQLRYLFSRLRTEVDDPVPVRFRLTTNPGGPSHDYIKDNYIENPDQQTIFISAQLEDNPYLDTQEYEQSLAELPPEERARLRHGDWDVEVSGDLFQKGWFKTIEHPPKLDRVVRHWDAADSESKAASWTAGVLIGLHEGEQGNPDTYYVLDVVRFKKSGGGKKQMISNIAEQDRDKYGSLLEVGFEQEPGSGGKYQAEDLAGQIQQCQTYIKNPTGSKVARAGPFRSSAELGNIYLIKGPWNQAYLDELSAFDNGTHDDQVDGSSGAFNRLSVDEKEKTKSAGSWHR
jgi:predicted phage terminase large subunit-like protein